ncbi:hypothetical protein BJ170DRAFT_62629 [Xylariales sp. AK1849]|nr:hypothetical protein BJ170DRAFT_62629 [Xylariales sp. AK1849]
MMKFLLILLPIAATIVATKLEQSAEDSALGTYTVHGCYSSVGELQLNGTNEFNSQGLCAADCGGVGAYVAATQATSCYCGYEYPPASTLVDDSKCNDPCPGFASDACGGTEAFTVINTGLKLQVENSTDDSSGSEASVTLSSSVTSASTPLTSVASVATVSETPVATTPTGSGSNATSSTGTSSTGSSAGASGSASASSSSPATVGTSGAVSQLSLSGLNLAVLSMGTVFLM